MDKKVHVLLIMSHQPLTDIHKHRLVPINNGALLLAQHTTPATMGLIHRDTFRDHLGGLSDTVHRLRLVKITLIHDGLHTLHSGDHRLVWTLGDSTLRHHIMEVPGSSKVRTLDSLSKMEQHTFLSHLYLLRVLPNHNGGRDTSDRVTHLLTKCKLLTTINFYRFC